MRPFYYYVWRHTWKLTTLCSCRSEYKANDNDFALKADHIHGSSHLCYTTGYIHMTLDPTECVAPAYISALWSPARRVKAAAEPFPVNKINSNWPFLLLILLPEDQQNRHMENNKCHCVVRTIHTAGSSTSSFVLSR